MWSSYQEMYMNIDNEKTLIEKRLEMVRFANEYGIKVAARVYSCSKNTIKKWCKRYAVYGIKGLNLINEITDKWIGKPYLLFRNYSIYYFDEFL